MANKKLNAVITIGGTVTGALKNALGTTRTKLQQIGGAIRDLEKEQRRLQSSMRDGINMGGPVAHLHQKYQAVTRQIEKARREQEKMNRAMDGMARGKAMMGEAAVAIGALTAAVATAGYPVVQAASFEKAMLGVAKQVEGARDKNGNLTATYRDMAKQIQQMGREIPIATNEIAEMVAAGARMGVAREELIGFTRTAAMMASAFELPADELADQMGKIAGLYKVPIPAIGELADTINYLDDNAIAKGGDIIDFLQRVGGTASMVRITGKDTAALGSTLLTLGEKAETASTAINAVFAKLGAANVQAKPFREMVAEIGMTTNQIEKGMQTDALGTIYKVMDRIRKLPKVAKEGGVSQIDAVSKMFGMEHWDTFSKLLENRTELEKQVAMANSDQAKGSMGREFAAQLATTNAQWEITKNRVAEVAVNIGGLLLPSINKVLGAIGSVTSAMADWVREHPVLTKNIIAVVGAIAGTIGAIKGVTFAIGAVTFAFNALKFAIMTNPIGLILTAIAVGAVLIYQNWEPIKAFFIDLWGKVTKAASDAWEWLKDKFLNWHPLGIVIKNWEPIKAYFVGLFDDIKATVRSSIDWVLQKISAVGNAWNRTKQFFGFGGDDAPARPSGAPAPRTPPPAPRMATARGGGSSFTDSSTHNWNITQQPGQDSKALARDVAAQLRRDQSSRAGSQLFDAPRGY